MATDPVIPFDYLEREKRRAQSQQGSDPIAEAMGLLHQEQIRSTIIRAPDAATTAQATRVARDAGEPPALIEDRVADVAKAQQADRFTRVLGRYPAFTGWAIQNPRDAVAAQNDHKSLGLLGDAWEALKAAPAATWDTITKVPATAVSAFNALGVQGAKINAGVMDYVNTAYDTYSGFVAPNTMTVGEQEAQAAEKRGYYNRGVSSAQARLEASRPEYSGFVQRNLLQGLESVPGSVFAMGAGALARSPNVALGLMGVQTGLPAVYDARVAGKGAGDALRYGIEQGAIESLTEKIPASDLLQSISKRTPFGKALMSQLSQEIPGEQVATALQDFSEWVNLHPERTFGQYLADRPEAALSTLLQTVSGTTAQTGGAIAVSRAASAVGKVTARIRQAGDAGRERAFFNAIERANAGSELKQLDPEAHARMMAHVAGENGVSNVFVPAEALVAYQQSDAYDQFEDPFKPYQAQIDEAAATGGDVVLPADFALGTLPGTPAWNAIKDDMRLRPGGMSAREAEDLNSHLDEIMGDLTQQRAEMEKGQASERDARAALVERVTKELQNAGFTPTNAALQAELIAQRAATRAARLGRNMQPGDFDTRIMAVLPPALAEMQKADRVDLVINAMRGGKEATKQTGKSLLDFIAARGGIEDRGGDIAAMGGDKWHRGKPGRRKLLKAFDAAQGNMLGSSGANPNSIRNTLDAAISEGFFPDLMARRENGEQIDDRELLDAIGQELGGSPVYAEAAKVDDVRLAADELRQMLEDQGRDPTGMSDAEIRQAIADQVQAMREDGTTYEQMPDTLLIDGVERSTRNSEGMPLAGSEEGVRAFYAWFGASKVVDEEGRPLVVYHGTGAEFDAFNGITWASVGTGLAQEYASMREVRGQGVANVMPLYMRAERVFDADLGLSKSETVGSFFNAALEQAIAQGREVDIERARALLETIRAAGKREESGPRYAREDFWFEPETMFGKDGATAIRDLFDLLGFDSIKMQENGTDTYGAFSPTQIKSINNRGTFDPADARILYQDAPRREPATVGETTGVSLANSLASAKTLALNNRFPTGRDLKLALQERSLAAQAESGEDLTKLDNATAQRLADFVVEDALEAVQDNMNAIGWYDRAVTAAKAEMAKIFPEIATDPHSEFAFIWALAVTSNGLKVDKNFELAAKAYEAWKNTGSFPADIGIGQAAKGINDGLALYSKLIDHFGSWEKARDFMVKEHTVRELENETGIPISGEGKGEMVRGAAILGPKIGNGFFSNLYGHFDGLTMDRWLMRSVGRWRGTLISINPKMVAQKRTEIREHFAALSPAALKGLKALYVGADVKLAGRMSEAQVDALANETAKRSMDPAWREQINQLEGGEDLRKLGNALAKYLDGQVEAPAGTKERAFIRQVFRQALERLQQKDGLESLTMADLQALLWYPEKLLYESAKKPAGQEVSSYDDDEAPDYANAARKLVRDRLGQAVRNGNGRQPDRTGSGSEPSGRVLNQDYPRYGQTLNEGPRGRITLPAGGWGAGQAAIELFQSRNPSTLLHELGHQWLEELRYDASLPDAPEQLKADWQTVQDWFKANGHPIGDDGMIPTEAHELWARGHERYLMEGKSPSSALARLFETFRGWLLNVYRTVDALRAPISPEIREVFDRLYATDEEIQQQALALQMTPLFKDAASAGMTGDEFDAYTRQVVGARDKAHGELLAKTMAAIKRRLTKAYNDERKGVIADETERLDNSPILASLRMMKDTPLSLEWLQDRMGQDVTDLLPKRVPPLWREGGANPDSIAEMAGFDSGQQMIEVLIGAERQHRQAREGGDQRTMRARMIDQAADAEMQRRHGDDPFNDGSIEQEAIAAINNELAGEVLATEIRLLSRKTGQRPTPYKLARAWARGKVRSGTVAEEASPGAIQRHARAVAKAGREAEKAMLAGKFDEAQRFKQQQMLSSALLAEAKAAHDEVQAAQARLEKIAKRKTMKSVDQDYLDQAHALLDDVDLGPRSQRSLDRQGKWEAWAAAREAEGYDVLRPDAFRPGTHWSRLPVETFLGLDETIGQVMHLGRLKQRLLDNQEQREWEEVFDEAESGAGNISGPPPADLAEPGWWGALKGRILAGDAALLKMETVFDWLDGGNPNGVFNRIAFRPIADAQSREQDMLKDYYGRIKALFEAVPAEVAARWNDVLTPPFIDVHTERPMRINRKQAVAMALNIGNAGNLQRLADGYRVSPAAVEQYLNDTLTAEEWQFVQGVWDTIDTLWPEIEALEKRVNGVAPEKIEPRAFATPHGLMRGGYYPAIYDTSRDYRAAENAGKETDLLEGRYTRATTRASATKERAEQVKRPILLDLGVINRHLGEVIHDITHREPVIQAHRFLNSERVRRAVDQALGPEIGKQLAPWVKFVANSWAQERAGNEGFGKFIGKARANATVVGMGFRATTMVTQIAGYSNSVEVVGADAMAKALAQFSANPVQAIRTVMEKSGEVRHRMDTLDRDLRTEIAKVAAANPATKLARTALDAKRFMFHGIGYMDMAVSVPTWMAGYSNAIAAGMSEHDAVYAGDKAVRQSQGAGAPKDLAAIQRGTGKWGEALKLMTMFYSYFSAQYQRERTLGRDIMAVDGRRSRSTPKLVSRAFFLLILPPLLTEVLRAAAGAGNPPDDDEWWTEWVLRKLTANALGPIPVVRDLFEPVWQGARGAKVWNPSLTPLQRAMDSIVAAGKDVGHLARGEETKHATKDLLETTGYITGLVPGQIASATQFLVDVGNGETQPRDAWDWVEGLSTGKIKEDH